MFTPVISDQFVVWLAFPKSSACNPSEFDPSSVNRDGPSEAREDHESEKRMKSVTRYGSLVLVDAESIRAFDLVYWYTGIS
jgi:hypothetical protein